MKLTKYFYGATLFVLAACGQTNRQDAALHDFDFVDHVAGDHAIMYYDASVAKVKLRYCASGPFNRDCPLQGTEREMTVDQFRYNIKSMFGILDYDVTRSGLDQIEAERAAIRLEIASGTLSEQEKAEADLQLSELDAAFENLERGVFYMEQVLDAQVLTSVSSVRQDFRRLLSMFVLGTKVTLAKEKKDEADVYLRYFGEGSKEVAKQRCKRLGGVSLLDVNPGAFIFGTRLQNAALKLTGLFEHYAMPIVDQDGKTLRTTRGLGYWLSVGPDFATAFDAQTGNIIEGSVKADKLAVLCLTDK